MIFDNLHVVIHHIYIIRHDDTCVRPCRRILAAAASRSRNNVGICSLVALRVTGVLHTLVEETVNIGIVSGSYAERLCVARPAVTFVTLRAVGRNAEVVAPLSPEGVGNELIYELIRGHDASDFLGCRAYDLRNKVKNFNIFFGCDLNISVTEEGKPRAVCFRLVASDYVNLLAERRTEIYRVKRAFCAVVSSFDLSAVVEELAVMNADKRSLFALEGKFCPADHLLTEINNCGLSFFECYRKFFRLGTNIDFAVV